MNNIMAAIGRGNLIHLKDIKKHINALGDVYRSYGMFAHGWLAGGFTNDYKALKQAMEDAGYEIGQHHYRNDKYTLFGGRQELPMMDAMEKNYFFVPLHMDVTLEDAHNIGKIYASK
jgi:perosamine synthetase